MQDKNSLVIGIAGGTGSGKSTIVEKLCKSRIGSHLCVLHHDSYYVDLAGPDSGNQSLNWDHPDSLENSLIAKHVQRLIGGYPIDSPTYDFATHRRRRETRRIEPRPIVIVEGILIFYVAELRSLFDLRIFVDLPAEERLKRRLNRDVNERGRTESSVIEQYQTTVKPMHDEFVEPYKKHAHLIIPGDMINKPIDVLVGYLESVL